MFVCGRDFDGVRSTSLYSHVYGHKREAEVWMKQTSEWTAEPNNLSHM